MVVKYPLDNRFKKFKLLSVSIFSSVVTSIIFCTIITAIMWSINSFFPSQLWMPFVDPTKSVLIIKFLTCLIVFYQLLITVLIVSMYTLLFTHLRKSIHQIKALSLNRMTDSVLILQIIVIVSASMCTWFTSGVIYISIMIVDKYPMEMVTWTIILISPIC